MYRFVLPDLLRMIAIILMVAYHLLFDLSYFWQWNIPLFSGAFTLIAHATAAVFLYVVGVTFWIVHRMRTRPTKRYILRLAQVALGAAAISVMTWFLMPETWVRFGILHLIAVSLAMLPLLVRRSPAPPLLMGIVIIIIGLIIGDTQYGNWALLPLGFPPATFASVDYFPLLPWFGFVLLGCGTAPLVLNVFPARYAPSSRAWIPLFPGRNALSIYVFHQPVLFAILTILLGWPQT